VKPQGLRPRRSMPAASDSMVLTPRHTTYQSMSPPALNAPTGSSGPPSVQRAPTTCSPAITSAFKTSSQRGAHHTTPSTLQAMNMPLQPASGLHWSVALGGLHAQLQAEHRTFCQQLGQQQYDVSAQSSFQPDLAGVLARLDTGGSMPPTSVFGNSAGTAGSALPAYQQLRLPGLPTSAAPSLSLLLPASASTFLAVQSRLLYPPAGTLFSPLPQQPQLVAAAIKHPGSLAHQPSYQSRRRLPAIYDGAFNCAWSRALPR
jgi:hypothetical protein